MGAAWLLAFCLSRAAFSLIFTTYSGSLSLLRGDWGMSAGEAGLIQSAWHIGYLTSLFAVGFFADRFGAKRTFLWTSLAASAAALLFAAGARDFWSGLLLHGLAGLCSGGSYTPGLAIVSQHVPIGRRGRAMGYYIAASSLGYAASLLLTSQLIRISGWQLAFWVTCAGPAVGAVIGLWALRDTPNVVNPLPADHGQGGSLLAVWRNRPAMLSIWGYVFHSWELLALWAWLPAYLAAAFAAVSTAPGGSAAGAATASASLGAAFSALTYLTSMAGSVAGGALSDRFGRTALMLTMACASLVCSFSFGWMIGLPIALVVAVALFYNFAGIGDSAVYSTALAELVPARYLGAAYSLRSVLGFGVGAISPWVVGLVLDAARAGTVAGPWAWGLAWCSVGLGAVAGPFVTWRLRRRPEAIALAGGLR
jgi:MFS family permease